MGPIINKHALQKLNDYIKGCKDQGMEVHNCNNSLKETHMSPTIIEIDNISAIQEEQFGPILHVMKYKFDDMNSVINQINESGYGHNHFHLFD